MPPSHALVLGERDRLARKAASKPDVISFAGGLPAPKLFPTRQLAAAMKEVVTDTQALQYGWPEGAERLRAYIAETLVARGARVTADRVIITNGAQQAIALAMGALRRSNVVAVDPESYPGALDMFRGAGAKLTTLAHPADAYYVMPSVSNPLGQRMSAEERRALLACAAKHRAFVIEDDAYDGTWFTGESSRPLMADDPDRVFHVGTFSKTLCPGLRIGWLVPPPQLARRVLHGKQNLDLQTNGLGQAVLERYLAGGHFAAHQRQTVRSYERRAALLLRSVAEHLPDLRFQAPGGGFSVWLEGDFDLDQKRLLAAGIERGVSFDPGYAFRARRVSRFALRLCYSSVAEAKIEEGVRRLARLVAAARHGEKRTRRRTG